MKKKRYIVIGAILICALLAARPAPSVAEDNVCSTARARNLWPKVAARLSGLLGEKPPPPPAFVIEKPQGGTPLWIGTYTDKTKTVHALCLPKNAAAFDSTIRHEATHHFLHSLYPHISRCLDEGLAAYMEAGTLTEGVAADHINPPRLREFNNMLQWALVPSTKDLLSDNVASLKPSQFYASCWALVFYLLHDEKADKQQQKRKALIAMLRNKGNSRAAVLRGLAGGGDINAWELRWHQALWHLRDKASNAPSVADNQENLGLYSR